MAFICNPSSLHVPVALACARARLRSVHREACLAFPGGAGRTHERSAARVNASSWSGYQLRFHPAFMALQQSLARGRSRVAVERAGRRRRVPARVASVRRLSRDVRRARRPGRRGRSSPRSMSSIICTLCLGCHGGCLRLGGHSSDLEIDVEDVASTLMEFHVDDRTLPVHLQQDYVQRPANRSCEVLGGRGKLIMDLPSVALTRYDGEGAVADSQRWATGTATTPFSTSCAISWNACRHGASRWSIWPTASQASAWPWPRRNRSRPAGSWSLTARGLALGRAGRPSEPVCSS